MTLNQILIGGEREGVRFACFKLYRMASNLFGTGVFRWLFVFSLYCERLVVIAYNASTAGVMYATTVPLLSEVDVSNRLIAACS